MTTTVFNLFNHPARHAQRFTEPSKTKQSEAASCDINRTIARCVRNGVPLPVKPGAFFGDFADMPSYAQAFDMMEAARESFESLPSKIRVRFGHDPAALMDFLRDEKNRDEAIALGLVNPPAVVVPPGSVVTETLKTTPPAQPVPPTATKGA